jgi:N-acetylglucosaminyldiphosphoundecaprenol N-acetyl-beta-D-mannosaminyltransferase
MDREASAAVSSHAARRLTGPAEPARAIPRVDVLGVGISAITMEQALAEITRWIETREQHYVCVTGVHGVMESQRDPELRRIHNRSGLTTPDGIPMVWAGRHAGATHMERVCGPDLMLAVCSLAAERGWPSYFYGSAEGVAKRLAVRLTARFPGLRVAGWISPPFRSLTPDEDRLVVQKINSDQPDLVWVGLSTPKQERWMAAHVGRLRAPVLLGVGAAFDLHAGLMRQAPPWMQRSGLEWLYRLYREPRRLWRRYLRNNPAFVLAILRRRPLLVMDGEISERRRVRTVDDRQRLEEASARTKRHIEAGDGGQG